MSSVFRARPTLVIIIGLASLSVATALSAPGCTSNDCSDQRLGTVRCVQNRIEYCLLTDEGNRLGYENCSSQGLFCSDQHKQCVTEDVLHGGDGGQGGTNGSGPDGSGGTGPNGTGGMGAMSGPSGTGGMGGMGGMGATSGPGGMGGEEMINGCTKSGAVVKTNQATVSISSQAFVYTPACVLVSAGSDIEMTLNFGVHPTKPGAVVGGMATEDNNSPIPAVVMGGQVVFNVPNAGAYPYFCDSHFTMGMFGTIYVE